MVQEQFQTNRKQSAAVMAAVGVIIAGSVLLLHVLKPRCSGEASRERTGEGRLAQNCPEATMDQRKFLRSPRIAQAPA